MACLRRCAGLVAILFLALAGGVAGAQYSSPVGFTVVLDHEVRETLQLTGSVEALRDAVLAAEVDGLVIELSAQEGDHVRKGQPLARLRTTNSNLQLQAAQGRLKEARARLELSESQLARARRLHADDVISQGDLDDAFSEFTAWQGRVDQTEAEIRLLEVALDRSVVRAPFSGVVVDKLTEVGQWMPQGGPVAHVMSLRTLEVKVDVPERYFERLQVDGAVGIRIESLPDYRGTGGIEAVIPAADPQARTFPVRVRIENREQRISVGMLAQVSLPVGESRRAVLVPKDAVVRQGQQELVYRIKDDETVEPVTVTSGQGLGSWIVVSGPVVVGDRVVTRGNERLRPGQEVEATIQEYALP